MLTNVYRLIHNGWPATHRQTHRIVDRYWGVRDELIYGNGLLLKGSRVIIPFALRESFLHDIHEEHMDITK